jgi:hypothetical protein
MKKYLMILMIVFLISSNRCTKISTSKSVTTTTPIPIPQTASYSPPNSQNTSYPSPIQSTPSKSLPQNAAPFTIDKPVLEGTTEITGKGTPGVPVIIFDVTYMGEVLGQGTIQPDGTFKILVPTLEKGHRIGLGVADLTGTKWKVEDFQNPAFNGDEAQLVPMVGFFFDTAMVQGK